MKYEVWCIPTIKGMKAFGWTPSLIGVFDEKEDADLCAYSEDADDPAPDKGEYRTYHVVCVKADTSNPNRFLFCKEEVFGALPEIKITPLDSSQVCEPIQGRNSVVFSASLFCPKCGCNIHVEVNNA